MIEIIPFRKKLQDQLVDLVLTIQRIEFNVPITVEDQPDLLTVDEFYRKSGGEFWVAVSEEKVVGSIALIRIGNNAGVIRKMFVKKEFRGKEIGIAQHLFETLAGFATEAGIENVYLGTIDRLHAALRFYERNGFKVIEKKLLPHDFPVMGVDNIFLHKEIGTN
jgi:putative acetyltransferase